MSDLPTKEELASLSELVRDWKQCVSLKEAAEAEVKRLNAVIAQYETDFIPALMASAGGVDKLRLDDGTELTVKDELYASISAANQVAAFAWLEENNHGDVIKDELKVALGRGSAATERAKNLIAAVEAQGISDYSRKRAVAPNTLQALLKEQLAEGVEIPKETFGVFQQRRAVIKVPKAAK